MPYDTVRQSLAAGWYPQSFSLLAVVNMATLESDNPERYSCQLSGGSRYYGSRVGLLVLHGIRHWRKSGHLVPVSVYPSEQVSCSSDLQIAHKGLAVGDNEAGSLE